MLKFIRNMYMSISNTKIHIILWSVLLLLVNCGLLSHQSPPTPPEPFKAVKSKKEIMGEWVCYYTYLTWKDGHEYFHLDKFKEEDKIIIDSARVKWQFKKGNDSYEYNFPYVIDTNISSFSKDTIYYFANYPIHHWSEPFGMKYDGGPPDYQWVSIGRLHDTLQFDSRPSFYAYETAKYIKKTW